MKTIGLVAAADAIRELIAEAEINLQAAEPYSAGWSTALGHIRGLEQALTAILNAGLGAVH